MKILKIIPVQFVFCLSFLFTTGQEQGVRQVTVPFNLYHNRMLVEAEVQRADGSFCKSLLWVDTGNPDFLVSHEFAGKLGIIADAESKDNPKPAPLILRIAGMTLRSDTIRISIGTGIQWLFNTMHNDGNIPSTLLKNYHVIFDYPAGQLTIAERGILVPRGDRSAAAIHPVTGIVQLDAVIDGEKYSFAVDNGSSFSFITDTLIKRMIQGHPDWPNSIGAVGCANIWGNWPGEASWPLLRIPVFRWGSTTFSNGVMAGLPSVFRGKTDVGTWYSRKTARRVDGFIGPNIFMGYRMEIDYAGGAVYFEKGTLAEKPDMDIVGVTLKPLNDGKYQVAGVAMLKGRPAVEGVSPGDILLAIDNLQVTGATMGTITDALRGKPGSVRVLTLERNGVPFTIRAVTMRVL